VKKDLNWLEYCERRSKERAKNEEYFAKNRKPKKPEKPE